jgi:uncharacterized membrane protein
MEIIGSSGSGKKIIAILFFLVAAFAIIFLALYPSLKKSNQQASVTNFQQCAAAGYPVMQSYPRECTLPDGKFFVEQNVPER